MAKKSATMSPLQFYTAAILYVLFQDQDEIPEEHLRDIVDLRSANRYTTKVFRYPRGGGKGRFYVSLYSQTRDDVETAFQLALLENPNFANEVRERWERLAYLRSFPP